MLVLNRSISESIMIDHELKIVVLDIKGSQVRLGIAASNHVSIHRLESVPITHYANE